MGGVCITETIPKQPLIRSLGESASRGTAQAKAVAKSIHDLLIIGQTAGKETNNHSEINGSNYNRLRNPIGKAGRPWRHGYCRACRSQLLSQESRIRKRVTASRTQSAKQFPNIYICSRAYHRARLFTYRYTVKRRRTNAGYHRHYCRLCGLIIYRKPSDRQVHREH